MIKIDKDECEITGDIDDILGEATRVIMVIKELIKGDRRHTMVFNDELLCCVQASDHEEFMEHQFVNPRVINMIMDQIGGV